MARTCATRWQVGIKPRRSGRLYWTVVSACTAREVVEKLERRGDLTNGRHVYAGPVKLKRGQKVYTS
jgi:hypothetical protein